MCAAPARDLRAVIAQIRLFEAENAFRNGLAVYEGATSRMMRDLLRRRPRRRREVRRKIHPAPKACEPGRQAGGRRGGDAFIGRGPILLSVEPRFAFGERAAKDFVVAFIEDGPNIIVMESELKHVRTIRRPMDPAPS
jgi:hypothetical protein